MPLNTLFNSSLQDLSTQTADFTIRWFFFLSDWISQQIMNLSLKIGVPLNAQAVAVIVTLGLVWIFIKSINKINNSAVKYGIWAAIIWLIIGFILK